MRKPHKNVFSSRYICEDFMNCYDTTYEEYIYVDLLGKLIKPDTVSAGFKKILRTNGLKKIRFNDLRHSCASLLLDCEVPMKAIQEWLGHSDIGTTANIYSHLEYKSEIASATAIGEALTLPNSNQNKTAS